jgi:hypothetical protein
VAVLGCLAYSIPPGFTQGTSTETTSSTNGSAAEKTKASHSGLKDQELRSVGADSAEDSPMDATQDANIAAPASVISSGVGLLEPFSADIQILGVPHYATMVDLTEPPGDVWQRIRHGFAVPNLDSPLVSEKQAWYVTKPRQLKIMFERASLYLYYITRECERRGLPTELALLPFIESAFNPHALSSARASGLWQFIPSTGRSYGLKQDSIRDERRDIIASTNAALDYLTTLYEMYGDWYLALAAYNWGEGSVARAIDRNRQAGLPTDYLSLSMPEETRHYVPKLQAIKNIINQPNAFNISLPQINNEPYFTTIVKPPNLDLKAAAKMADMTVEEFKALNPSFNRPMTKKSDKVIDAQTTLLVPISKVDVFVANLDKEGTGDVVMDAIPPYVRQTTTQGAELYVRPTIGLKNKVNRSNTNNLQQLIAEGAPVAGEELGGGSGLYRDPYLYAQQASQISQANPLAQIKRYASEEPRKTHTAVIQRSGKAAVTKDVGRVSKAPAGKGKAVAARSVDTAKTGAKVSTQAASKEQTTGSVSIAALRQRPGH